MIHLHVFVVVIRAKKNFFFSYQTAFFLKLFKSITYVNRLKLKIKQNMMREKKKLKKLFIFH